MGRASLDRANTSARKQLGERCGPLFEAGFGTIILIILIILIIIILIIQIITIITIITINRI